MSGTMHAHYMGLAGSALRTAIGLTAGLCFLAFGYGQGDIGGLMVVNSFGRFFPEFDVRAHPDVTSYAIMAGVVVSSWNIGCFVGAFFTIFVGDRLGRKGTIMLGLVLELIGKLIQVSSFSLGQYIAGRVIAGVGNGFIASTIPAWQAECLKTHQRGTLLLVSFGTFMTLGVATAYWITYGLSFAQPNSASWRFPIAFVLLFILPAIGILTFMPESPRWLLLQGKEQEAIKVLSALNELPEDSEDVRRELLQIKNAVKNMASAPLSNVVKNGDYRFLHRTLLAVGLQVMQQWTGVNLFIQYLGAMFAVQLAFPAREALLLAAGCATEFFLASLVAVIGIDRFWGRRTLTMFGAAGMCISMIMLSAMNWLALVKGVHTGFYVMAAFLFLYNTCFSIGWQGMSWMWSVELIPLSIRGPANALATAANWLSNYMVVILTPVFFANITWRTYILFAVTNFCIVPIIYIFYPETGGRSLEEVDVLFRTASKKGGNTYFTVVGIGKQQLHWYDKNGDPTDSYGSGSDRGEWDVEKGSSAGESPETVERRKSTSRPPTGRRSTAEEAWENRGPAPSPSVRRTHSNERSYRGKRSMSSGTT